MKVRVMKKEVVAAALPTQGHWLPLSNLDLLLPPLDFGVFFCYDDTSSMNRVAALKVALAKTLVSYYPFSGELVPNSAGEPELLCNNSGVDFFEASADLPLNLLDLYNPDASVQHKLMPTKNRGVLAVQATELKCGGMVVACTFDHRVADAYTANMFLVSWSETARSNFPLSLPPSFRRSLLYPRRPLPLNGPSFHDLYVNISELPPPPQKLNTDDDETKLTSRIYYVTFDQLCNLQQLASDKSSDKKPTKLESLSSLLWKLISKFATNYHKNQTYNTNNEPNNNDVKNKRMSRMGIVVDGRGRLGNMDSYFGNVLSIPYGEKTVDDLSEKPLSWVAQVVHQVVEKAVTKEHFLGLVDWVETQRPEPKMCKIYMKKRGEEDWPAFVVSSGQRFPVTKVDFGWGKPVFGSYHFPWGGDAGYVMPMPSPLDNGDWIVYLHLTKAQLHFIESEASHVFHPITPQYLSL